MCIGHFFSKLRNRMGRAHARDDVFTLGVDEVFAVKYFFAGGGIARKCNASRAAVSHVPEHHRLHVYRRSPIMRNPIFPSINDCAIIHP